MARRLFSLLLLLSAIAYGFAGIYIENERELVPERMGETIDVIVEEGAGALEAAESFRRAGAVTNAGELVKWMVREGIDKKLLPGTYRVIAGRPSGVASQLTVIKPSSFAATIIPGSLFEDIAVSLGRDDAELLLEAALGRDENFPESERDILPDDDRERIMLLAPETYAVASGDKRADSLISRAAAKWWEQHGDAVSSGMTGGKLNSLGILASIVQKEALMDADRPLIAGVMQNRLKQNMPLQVDATVVYAWKKRGVKKNSLTYNDLKIESPYNTYLNNGLPPGNIGVPGKESWDAVLNPADTDMMFYFAKKDGFHVFTRTYQEHLAAQKKEKAGAK